MQLSWTHTESLLLAHDLTSLVKSIFGVVALIIGLILLMTGPTTIIAIVPLILATIPVILFLTGIIPGIVYMIYYNTRYVRSIAATISNAILAPFIGWDFIKSRSIDTPIIAAIHQSSGHPTPIFAILDQPSRPEPDSRLPNSDNDLLP